ncbi:MAG: universal stress protein [Steroidobacteraceae bacterium]
MTPSPSNPTAARKVLLATDLSARGDRALERAVAIAASQQAHLIIVHVFEEFEEATLSYGEHSAPSWRRPPDAVAMAKLRIREGLRTDLGDAVETATVLIEQGDPAGAIERIARSEAVDLVVVGLARESLFASRAVILGKTVEKLLRKLPIPILIVRNRARTAYQHIVVATDFSEPSAHALQAALRYFPMQTLYLLHASDTPYAGHVSDADRHAQSYTQISAAVLETFLGGIFLPEDERKRLVPVIEPGRPQQIIREYVQMHAADLVVLGTHGRGAVLEALLGSTAKSILSSLPCDTLVVRGPPQ